MRLLLVCVILPLVAWCAPAGKEEVVPDESAKPLIRTKRAEEEVLFGNHQNEARVVKKSDPSLGLIKDEDVINSNELVAPEQPKSDNILTSESGNIVEPDNGDVDSIFSDDAKSVGDLAEDEEMLEGEHNGILSPEGADDSSGEVPAEGNMMDNEKDMNYRDYYDYFYPNVGYGRYRRNTKQKRAAPAKLLTADNMEPAVVTKEEPNQRFKRDLTADELEDWLQNGDVGSEMAEAPSMQYYPEYDTGDTDRGDTLQKLALEQLLEPEYQEEVPNNVDYPLYPEYPEEQEEEDPEKNKQLLSLLEYLESEAPREEESDVGSLYPDDIQEQWDDLDLDPDIPYEPIVYNGVPGVFIPMDGKASTPEIQKRQYLSMVPGVRKRVFEYPYNMEPEGGRWGAFVEPEEEKRTADAYERLYRLAEALKDGSRDYYK